jgi:hypothetical protein
MPEPMRWRIGTALVLMGCNLGCGIALQTAVGWTSPRVDETTEDRRVEIVSEPPGAIVVRTDAGQEAILGTAPLTDRLSAKVSQTVDETRIWGVALGLGVEVAGLITMVALSPKLCEDGGVDAMGMPVNKCSPVMIAGVATFGIGMFFDLIGIALAAVMPDQVTHTEDLETPRVSYRTELPGYRPAIRELAIAESEKLTIKLFPDDGTIVAKSLRFDRERSVVAVMPVSQSGAKLEEVVSTTVEDQLRVSLSKVGLKTIDRGAQESARQAQVLALKAESYKACYDEACQIELGKALAATHLLRSRLTQLGAHCLLSAELVDLALEVTVNAASAEGQCEPEALLQASRLVATDLLSH